MQTRNAKSVSQQIEGAAGVKVTKDLRGCSRGKKSYAHHFKGKHGKLYIVGKLNKCRFREKISIAGFFNSAKENRKQPGK